MNEAWLLETCKDISAFIDAFFFLAPGNSELAPKWTPLQRNDNMFILIHALLSQLDFERYFHLNVEDQITMVDIEYFLDDKVRTVTTFSASLPRPMRLSTESSRN